jgi:hypothetical protein
LVLLDVTPRWADNTIRLAAVDRDNVVLADIVVVTGMCEIHEHRQQPQTTTTDNSHRQQPQTMMMATDEGGRE